MTTKINFPPQQPNLVTFASLGIGDAFFSSRGSLGIKTRPVYDDVNALIFHRSEPPFAISFDDDEMVEPADIEISVTQRSVQPAESTDLNIAEKEFLKLHKQGTLASGRIHAIRCYRERLGCGLKEAKDKGDEYLAALSAHG